MINEFDKVKIKQSGIVGEVIDIYTVDGEKHYTVESEGRGVPGGRGYPEDWKLFDCKFAELEKVQT